MIHSKLFSAPLCLFIILMVPFLSYARPDKFDKIETTAIETPTLQESLKIIKAAKQDDIKQVVAETGDTPIDALPEELRSWFQSAGFASDLTFRQALEQLENLSGKPLTSEKAVQEAIKTVMSDPQLLPVKLIVETHQNQDSHSPVKTHQDSGSDSALSPTGILSLFHSGLSHLPFSINAQTLTPFLSLMVILTQLVPSYADHQNNFDFCKVCRDYVKNDCGLNATNPGRCNHCFKNILPGCDRLASTSKVPANASSALTEAFNNTSTAITELATSASTRLTKAAQNASESITFSTTTDDDILMPYLTVTLLVIAVTIVIIFAYIYKKRTGRSGSRLEL